MKKRAAVAVMLVLLSIVIAITSLSAYAAECPPEEQDPCGGSYGPYCGDCGWDDCGGGNEPFCGDGGIDSGENCVNCPADVGVCAVIDPCAIGDLDISKTCCEARGFTWVASGEEMPFGGYELEGQQGCAGDDAGEYARSMECQGGGCATNQNDKAACSSPYSCVLDGKCYTRLDKAVQLGNALGSEVNNRGSESDDSVKSILEKMYELDMIQRTMLSNKMLKKIGGEMAGVLLALKKKTSRDTGRMGVVEGSTEKQPLLCLPKV